MLRKFDLNIDKILENWEPSHAIRELIANALDEQSLSSSKSIEIYKNQHGNWTIRDFGRGLSYESLIQSENPEKLGSTITIGKFGVGLKDALATLWRHNIRAKISSKYGCITLERSSKHEFEDLTTLHAVVEDTTDKYMVGTEITLDGCSNEQLEASKAMFLHFNNPGIEEKTSFGEVISNPLGEGTVYLNGLKIACESNFLFSYNITSPNAAIKRALNRERTNVGRAAYTDRVKNILLNCSSDRIIDSLASDLELVATGKNHDELAWLEVQSHACKLLSKKANVVFVTADERTNSPSIISHAQKDGLKPVTIPDRLREKVTATPEDKQSPVKTLSEYTKAWNQSFQYDFVSEGQLTVGERELVESASKVGELIDGMPEIVKNIRVSTTMRAGHAVGFDADGVWQSGSNEIIVKRGVLDDPQHFYGVLLHEIAHAKSGASDATIPFETELTRLLGVVALKALTQKAPDQPMAEAELSWTQMKAERLSTENQRLQRKQLYLQSAINEFEKNCETLNADNQTLKQRVELLEQRLTNERAKSVADSKLQAAALSAADGEKKKAANVPDWLRKLFYSK